MSPIEYALTYLESCTLIEGYKPPERKKQNPINGCEPIPLPDYDLFFLKNCSLFSALDKRKTVREFYPFKSNIQDLSNLLFTAFGYFHQHKEGEFDEYKPFKRRSSPSRGCLQSIEAFVCVFNVSGLQNGIYWYDAEHHSLLTVHDEISYDDLSAMLASQFFGENCSFGIFLAANLERFTWKYKTTRAYRVVSMEVGHFSQTAQLCAAALQLNTWITGAFNDSKIEQLLKIDQEQSIPLFFLAFGNGRYRRMHTLMEQQAERYKSKD
jgi:SagB-type dehydrogenase family enzyme